MDSISDHADRTTDTPITLLIADDDPVTRSMLSIALARRFDVVGVVEDAQQAVDTATLARPDVALVDVQMPGGGGLTAVRGIVQRITTHRGGHALQRRIGRKRPGTPQRRRGLLRTQGHRRRRADSDRATSDPRATQTRCRPVAPSRATQPSAAARQPEGATPSTPALLHSTTAIGQIGPSARALPHRLGRHTMHTPRSSPLGWHATSGNGSQSDRYAGSEAVIASVGEAITPRAVIGPSLGRHCDRRARAGARTKAIAASRGRARSVLGDSTSAAAAPSAGIGVAKRASVVGEPRPRKRASGRGPRRARRRKQGSRDGGAHRRDAYAAVPCLILSMSGSDALGSGAIALVRHRRSGAGSGRLLRRQRHRQPPGGRKHQSDHRDCGEHTRAPGWEEQRGTESARVASESGRTRSYLPCVNGNVRESEQDQVAFERRCWFAWRTGTAARGRLRLGLP